MRLTRSLMFAYLLAHSGRPRHEGTTWGEDVLLNDAELQLDFSALAVAYLWVFTLDAGRLLSSIDKFPESSAKLRKVQRRWRLRRAVVRHAERICHREGVEFRGRFFPIYAKEINRKLQAQRAADEPVPVVSISRLENATRLSHMACSHRTSENGEGGVPRSLGGQARRISSRFSQAVGAVSPRLVALAPGTASEPSPTTSTPKSPEKRAPASSSGGYNSAKAAAANYGQRVRQEKLREGTSDSSRQIAKLAADVVQLQADVSEILTLLRSRGSVASSAARASPRLQVITPDDAECGSGHGSTSRPCSSHQSRGAGSDAVLEVKATIASVRSPLRRPGTSSALSGCNSMQPARTQQPMCASAARIASAPSAGTLSSPPASPPPAAQPDQEHNGSESSDDSALRT